MIRRGALLALLLLAGGCGGKQDGPATANIVEAASPSPVSAPVDQKARLAAAVRAAYPTGTGVLMGPENPRLFDEHRLIDAPFGPVLLSYGTIKDGSHATGGVIAVHYLAADGSGFKRVRSFPEAVQLGSNGRLTEWSVSDKFSDLPILYSEGGGTWQGYTCAVTLLTELRADGPAEVASIPTVYDYTEYDPQTGKDGPTTSIEGKIADVVKGKSFSLRYSGTSSFVERYVRAGDRFVVQGGKSRMPTC